MRLSLAIKALGALAMILCGCTGMVIDPLESDPDSDSGSGSEPGDSVTPNAIAMRMSQWAATPQWSTYGSGSQSQFFLDPRPTSPTDPDDLVLFFGSRAQACAAPVIEVGEPASDTTVCADQAFWQTLLVIPAALAHPGLVALSTPEDPNIAMYAAEWHADCGGGAGNTPGAPGTLEIVSIDASSVVVKLAVEAPNLGFVSNGDYTAPVCP